MNRDQCLRAVNQLMEDRRTQGKIESNRRREEIGIKVPAIGEKERQLRENHAAFFRFIADHDNSEEKFMAFRDKSLALQAEITQLLVENGYPADYLDPVYHCSLCADEGVVDGQLCACYKQALSEQFLTQSGMEKLFARCSFASFDLTLFGEEADESGLSPRERMKKLLDFSKKYVKTFGEDSQNLLFVGEPGCGKTFLSVCIGCELIRSGKFVLYAPVQDLLADFEAATFKGKAASVPTEEYLEADLLIIDDLGTEFYSSFVESTLYTVINTRLTRKKPTVISTNLSAEDREQFYAARLNSRLTYSFANVGFPATDLRAETLKRKASRRKKQ